MNSVFHDIQKSLITEGKGCGLGSSVNNWSKQVIYPVITFTLESPRKTSPVFRSMQMALVVTGAGSRAAYREEPAATLTFTKQWPCKEPEFHSELGVP